MLQFKQMKDACPKYVLTPGSNTSDIIYRRAAHIDTTPLLPLTIYQDRASQLKV